MTSQYFVNDSNRLLEALTGCQIDRQANVEQLLALGYREVTIEQQASFKDETSRARDSGWNPYKGISFDAFMNRKKDLAIALVSIGGAV